MSSRESSLTREHKRQRQESGDADQSGTICQKCDLLVSKAIDCAVCKLSFCLGCAKIGKSLFHCMVEGELENFHWTCRSCRSMFPTIEGISSTVKDIQKNHEQRMSKMEERMSKMETNTKHEIKHQVSSMKDQIVDSLKLDINKLVDSRSRELEDRKRRELNVTVFNLREHDYELGRDNKNADEQDMIEISASIGLENLNIMTSYRLGKKEDGKTRPLKLILDSKAQRKFLLENAKHTAAKARPRFQRVIITKDLTVEQRKERREKVQDRRRIRNNQRPNGANSDGEDNQRDMQNATVMHIDEQEPSPIARDSQLSHLAHIDDTNNHQNDTLSAYNNTTITSDETVIGGFDSQKGRLRWPPPAAPNL